MVQPALSGKLQPGGSAQRTRFWLVIAVLLMAVYAVPVFVPPASAPPALLAPDATLAERLFPGVPGWWVVVRLLSLATAAVLLSWTSPGLRSPTLAPRSEGPEVRGLQQRLQVSFGSALLQAAAGLWASHFSRAAQLLYVAWLAVPTLVLAQRPPAKRRAADWRALVVVGGIIGLWLLLRVPAAWRSPRAADLVDTWIGVRFLAQAADPSFNLLTSRVMPGSGGLHFMLQGAGLPSMLGVQPSFLWAQAAQFVWVALAGLLLGLLAARLLGLAAASVVTAVFLFSPAMLMTLLSPLPFFAFALVTAGLLILLVRVHDDRSLSALVGLAALAGIGATLHSTSLVSVAILCAALWSASRSPRLPKRGLVIAVLLFFAGAVTAMSDVRAIASMAPRYSHGKAQWVGHETAGFGQVSPALSGYTVEAAMPRPLDTVLSAVLAPFAVPRTPLRALGDTFFDPVGSALSAIGIGVCVRALRSSWLARILLGVLALALLPATVSSQDRIPLIRLLVTPVPMALLAGIGWETLRCRLAPSVRPAVAAGISTAAIAVGGMVVFDVVNPRVLPASWVGLTLQSLANNVPTGGALVLDHPNPHTFPYWHLNEIMADIPREPIAVRVYDRSGDLSSNASSDHPAAELLFWNPGLEEDRQVSQAMCERWPRAALYTLIDQAGRSRVFAARPQGAGWRPALSDAQWRVEGCDAQLETEATWAADIERRARVLTTEGRRQEAVAVLRAAARQNFAQAGLFRATAQAMLVSPTDALPMWEAVHWARRACEVTRFRDPAVIATLATAYAAAGQFREAIDSACQAKEVAIVQGNEELADELDRRAREYETSAAPNGKGSIGCPRR